MTIAAAWVRTLDETAEELLFCADSRLSGGKRFDQAQKIFRFTRTDAAICFAGGTDWAYPMIVAAIKAADVHEPSRTRSLGLAKFKSHVVNVLNQMQHAVHCFTPGEEVPDVAFVLGGYDWWSKCFRIWSLKFDKQLCEFRSQERTGSNGFGHLGKIEIAGDLEWVKLMRARLKTLAQQRYGLDMRQPDNMLRQEAARFDLEPFECIRDLLRQSRPEHSIGGAPQAVKVYQYLNSTDVAVFWPQVRGGRLCLSGRPLLEYERANIRSVLDPDTLRSTWSNGNSQYAHDSIERAGDKRDGRRPEESPAPEDILDAEVPDVE